MPISMMRRRVMKSIISHRCTRRICATPRKGALFAMYRTAEHDADHADDRVRGLLHEEDTRAQPTMIMAVHAKRMISPLITTTGQVHQCPFATRTVLRDRQASGPRPSRPAAVGGR